jgi:hypothetical protein
MLQAQAHLSSDGAVEAWSAFPQRDRYAAERAVLERERVTDRLVTGGPRALRGALDIHLAVLSKFETLDVAEDVAHKGIDADLDISAAGKEKRHAAVRTEYDAKRAAEAKADFENADELLNRREAALTKRWEELHAAPAEVSVEQRLLESQQIANLIALSKAGGSNTRTIELIHRAAAAGDAAIAGGLLKLLAVAGNDALLLRQATLVLRPRVAALQAAAFDPRSREIAAELVMLRSARAAFRSARGFMADRPGDTDLARQLVKKAVRGLEI